MERRNSERFKGTNATRWPRFPIKAPSKRETRDMLDQLPDETRALLMWRGQGFQVGRKTGERLLATATRGRTKDCRDYSLSPVRRRASVSDRLFLRGLTNLCCTARPEREEGGVIHSQAR
jgi:hypothetical protein